MLSQRQIQRCLQSVSAVQRASAARSLGGSRFNEVVENSLIISVSRMASSPAESTSLSPVPLSASVESTASGSTAWPATILNSGVLRGPEAHRPVYAVISAALLWRARSLSDRLAWHNGHMIGSRPRSLNFCSQAWQTSNHISNTVTFWAHGAQGSGIKAWNGR